MKKMNRLLLFSFLLIVILQSCKKEPEPPTLILSATPQTIEYNGTATLTWETNHATSCIFSGGSLIDVNGSITTPPLTETTTYNFTATGQGGTTSKSITIKVNEAPKPTIIVSVDNDTVPRGSTVNILIESTNAVSIKIVGVTTGDPIPETTERTFPQLNGTFTTWELHKSTHFTITATGIDNSTAASDIHVNIPTKKDTLTALLCAKEWYIYQNWKYINDSLVEWSLSQLDISSIYKFNPDGTFHLKTQVIDGIGYWHFNEYLNQLFFGRTDCLISLTESEMILGYYRIGYDYRNEQSLNLSGLSGYTIYRHP